MRNISCMESSNPFNLISFKNFFEYVDEDISYFVGKSLINSGLPETKNFF